MARVRYDRPEPLGRTEGLQEERQRRRADPVRHGDPVADHVPGAAGAGGDHPGVHRVARHQVRRHAVVGHGHRLNRPVHDAVVQVHQGRRRGRRRRLHRDHQVLRVGRLRRGVRDAPERRRADGVRPSGGGRREESLRAQRSGDEGQPVGDVLLLGRVLRVEAGHHRARGVDQGQVLSAARELEVRVQRARRDPAVLVRGEDHQVPAVGDHRARLEDPLGELPRVVGQGPTTQVHRAGPGHVVDLDPILTVAVLILDPVVVPGEELGQGRARSERGPGRLAEGIRGTGKRPGTERGKQEGCGGEAHVLKRGESRSWHGLTQSAASKGTSEQE